MSVAPVALADAQFDEIRDLINARSGIRIGRTQRLSLEASLSHRLRELRLTSFDHYMSLLTTGPYQTDEFESLLERTHVLDRCLFRHARQLADLRRGHLQPLFDASEEPRRLRVWCPGCATGEEAYTIAILIHDTLGERAHDWRVEILGTDVAERALAHASRAVFRPASFPAIDQRIRRRYFAHEQGGLRVDPEVRAMVSFRRHTLTDVLGAAKFGAWDIVFFRDLITWLEPGARADLLWLFHDRLAPGGRLVLGPTESARASGVPFIGVRSRLRGVFARAEALPHGP